jgi:hypothetical protein
MGKLCSVLLPIAIWGCSQGPTAPQSVPIQDLSQAPSSVVIGGKTLVLGASLWRDFQPIAPPDGRPLVAVLQVRTDDGSVVPADVRADAVWIVFGADVWSVAPREERQRSETTPVYELVARDGPKWGPGVDVDVVVRLRAATGASQLLRVRKQPIKGTF